MYTLKFIIFSILAASALTQIGKLRQELGLDYLPRRYPDIRRSQLGLRRQNRTLQRLHNVISEFNLIHDEENLGFKGRARFINLQEVGTKKAKGSKQPKARMAKDVHVKATGRPTYRA